MNIGVDTEEDYKKYSYNLKGKDKNYTLYHFETINVDENIHQEN